MELKVGDFIPRDRIAELGGGWAIGEIAIVVTDSGTFDAMMQDDGSALILRDHYGTIH